MASVQRPVTIKLINSLGRLVYGLGLKPSLDPEQLMARARQQTGLSDFGHDSFRPALEKLCASLDQEAQLSVIGRVIAHQGVLEKLKGRLAVVAYRQQHPEVQQQRIQQPLIIAGMPRTGTTILYELLAQDPIHRFPLSWEVERPVPPVKPDQLHTDPRIAGVQKQFDQVEQLVPGFKAIHEIGAKLPQECVAILAYHFMSEQWTVSYNLPSYRQWLMQQDFHPAYEWHRDFIQHLQSGHGDGQRWLLKTPPHIAFLDTLLDIYPDACVVQTHRDPMQVMASLSSLTCSLRSLATDAIDPLAIGQEEVQMWRDMLNRGMRARARMPERAGQFFDIRFTDILQRPLEIIEDLYRHFDFDFSDEVRGRMQDYLDNRPRDKHGSHDYRAEDYGLNMERDRPLFEEYIQTYLED